MGNFNLNSGLIQEHYVQVVTENDATGGFNVIHVSITSEYHTVKYRVSSDERHPDLKRIEQDLKQGLATAQQGGGDFGINEYLERSYIFVSYPNGVTEQYTANRI